MNSSADLDSVGHHRFFHKLACIKSRLGKLAKTDSAHQMQIIYADESGYSGSNFIDPNDPVFVTVSTSIRPEEAGKLLSTCIGAIQSEEYKYTNLLRNETRARSLSLLLNEVVARQDEFVTYIVHKKFALLSMWAAVWTYPWLKQQMGYDIRKQGFSKFMPNAWFNLLPTYTSERFLDQALLHFQTLMRRKTIAEVHAISDHFRQDFLIKDPELYQIMSLMIEPIESMGTSYCTTISNLQMDVSLPGLLYAANLWKQRLEEKWALHHDDSSHLRRNQELIAYLTSSQIEHRELVYSDARVVFPFDLEEIKFIDSKSNHSIQLCDVVAGAVRDRVLADHGYKLDPLTLTAIDGLDIPKLAQGYWAPDPRPAQDVISGGNRLIDTSEAHEWLQRHVNSFRASSR